MSGWIPIPTTEEVDLNNYISPGMYYRSSGSQGLIKNAAPAQAQTFTLLVHKTGRDENGVIQLFLSFDGTIHSRAYRHYGDANDWSSWKRLAVTGESFIPTDNNIYNIGSALYKWANIYTQTAPIVGSGSDIKEDIREINEQYINFLMSLKPVVYKFKDDENNTYLRMHAGFIAPEVEQALYDNGLNSLDFAGFINSPNTEEIETGEFTKDENGNDIPVKKISIIGATYGLRLEEFIPLITKTVQIQQKAINDLTTKINALEAKHIK